MSRIMEENFFVSVDFQSATQMEQQVDKVEEAMDAVIDKFSGKDYIVHASCFDKDDDIRLKLGLPVKTDTDASGYDQDDDSTRKFPIETDTDTFFANYQRDDEPRPKRCEEDEDEEHNKTFDVCIRFIGTKKGRAQLEKMQEAFDAELDKFEEKGLIDSYYRDEVSETDATANYFQAEIREIQKVHNVKIRRRP